MRRYKVCHVITMLELGGAQQNTLYTAAHLDKDRFDVLLVSGPGGMLDEEARSKLPRTMFAPHLAREIRPFSDFRALWELFRIFRRESPEIVHTHSSKAGILGRLAAFLAGVPVRIHTFHGFGFHDAQSRTTRRLLLAAERFCARLSHALVFVSEANLETAQEKEIGLPAKRRVIRSGIDFDAYPAPGNRREALRREFDALGRPLIVSIGNLKPQKNPEDFVRAAARVRERAPDARFVFVGDGVLRTQVEARVKKLGLEGVCRFPGWRRDTPELLAAADIFVLTSLWEGLPRSLVEALRSGLPCVCYDADGVRDLLHDGIEGRLIERGDWPALADAVSQLLEREDQRKRMADSAGRAVSAEFDIRGMVRAQDELYQYLAHHHAFR